jgi:hypothetical protein
MANTDGTFVVTWDARPDRYYDLYRSTNDLVSYNPVATNLTVGSYTDTVSSVTRAVYRLRVRLQ